MPSFERIESETAIRGVYIVWPKNHSDSRGWFAETWRRAWIPGAPEMLQTNRSDSRAGVLRGLHYHLKQTDFWYVTRGSAIAGLYDFRSASPTRGGRLLVPMGEDNQVGLYIPPGVAHGFSAHTDLTLTYLVDQYHDGSDEFGIRWNDPDVGLDWPAKKPILSERDEKLPLLAAIPGILRPE